MIADRPKSKRDSKIKTYKKRLKFEIARYKIDVLSSTLDMPKGFTSLVQVETVSVV